MSTPGNGVYFVPGPPPTSVPHNVPTAHAFNQRAQSLIRNNVLVSLGIGLIPVPILDVAALLGQQLYMIRSLGEIYGQRFSEDLGKKALLALLGAMLPRSFSWKLATASLLKSVPLLGTQLSLLATPLLAAATTYALGEVFNRHFASGGTFLSFDPVKHQQHFEHMLGEGLKMARTEQATMPVAAYGVAPMMTAAAPMTVPGGVHVDSSGVFYGTAQASPAYSTAPVMVHGVVPSAPASAPSVTHGVLPVMAHVDAPGTPHVDVPTTPHIDQAVRVQVPTTHVDAPGTPHVDRSVNVHSDLPGQAHVDTSMLGA